MLLCVINQRNICLVFARIYTRFNEGKVERNIEQFMLTTFTLAGGFKLGLILNGIPSKQLILEPYTEKQFGYKVFN